MSPLEASMTLATFVGLLCNWKQERGTVAQDRFQDFIAWLEQHHFNELRDKITTSQELSRQFAELLREDNKLLGSKLDLISNATVSIAARLDRFNGLVESLSLPVDKLSDQAVELLRLFDQTGSPRMVIFVPSPARPYHIKFLPKGGVATVGDVRFLESDLRDLCALNLIAQVDFNSSGEPIYSLTRSGSSFAQSVKFDTHHKLEPKTAPPELEVILV